MLDKLRAEYKEAQAKLARREQLRVMLNDAAAQLNEITVRERALYEQLQKENADVDVMERTTVTSVFYTLLGKKEEKLKKGTARGTGGEARLSGGHPRTGGLPRPHRRHDERQDWHSIKGV